MSITHSGLQAAALAYGLMVPQNMCRFVVKSTGTQEVGQINAVCIGLSVR